jgi:hypothetical protein
MSRRNVNTFACADAVWGTNLQASASTSKPFSSNQSSSNRALAGEIMWLTFLCSVAISQIDGSVNHPLRLSLTKPRMASDLCYD